MNRTEKIIIKDSSICFVIRTKGKFDYWWWEISRRNWEDYWLSIFEPEMQIKKWMADKFINDDENSSYGYSCSSFLSVEDAIRDYTGIEVY